MSEDYQDYKKWTEQTCCKEYLSDYEEYSLEDISSLCARLLEKAHEEGLVNCFLRFASHYEDYEDFLGSPSVVAVGYRPLSQEEKEAVEDDEIIAALAEEKGITFYEARHLKSLRDKGIVE